MRNEKLNVKKIGDEKMIGWDMDGVICTFEVKVLSKCKNWEERKEYYNSQTPLTNINFDKNVTIITGRNEDMREESERWLKEIYPNVKFEVVCVGYDSKSSERKVEEMRKRGITHYIDDNMKWVKFGE